MSSGKNTYPYLEEIKCQSYDELKDKYKFLEPENENNVWLYRGQSESNWSLMTTFERDFNRYKGYENTNYCECFKNVIKQSEEHKNDKLRILLSNGFENKNVYEYENNIIREFKRKAKLYMNTPVFGRHLEWLSLMRHYGAPVRLLDCTYSFYVALYYAIKDADGSCAVYAFNQELFKDGVYNEIIQRKDIIELLRDSSFQLDREIGNYFNQPWYKLIVNVTPFNHNERIALQQGSFLVPGNIEFTFVDNLLINIEKYKKLKRNVDSPVKKFILLFNPNERRKTIEELYRMNITGHSLNPNLDGFCETLRFRFRIP